MGNMNVSPEVMAALKQAAADGKITKDELAEIEKLGASEELIAKLSGSNVKFEGDKMIISHKKAAEKPETEEKPWYKKAWDWAKENPVKATVGAVAAAAVAVGAGMLIAGSGGTATPVVIAAIGLLGLTSCTSDGPDVIMEGNKTDIDNNITANITAKIDIGELKSILKETLGDKLDNITELLAAIKADTNIMKAGQEKILIALAELGLDVKNLYENMDIKGAEIIKLLKENNSKQDDILNAISEGNKDTKALLEKILNAVKAGNEIGTNNGNILNEILEKLKDLKQDNTVDTTKIEALLNAILAKVTEGVEQNKDMDTETHTFLQNILDKLDTMDTKAQELLQAILAKLDSMDNGIKAGLTNVINNLVAGNEISENILAKLTELLNKVDKMSDNNKAAFEAILNAIKDLGDKAEGFLNVIINNQNLTSAQLDEIKKAIEVSNQISDKTLAKVTEILNKLGSMSATNQAAFDAILNAIKNLGGKAEGLLNMIISNQNLSSGQLEEIRKAIVEGNKINQGTQNMINDLGDLFNRYGQEVLAVLEQFKDGTAVSLDKVIEMLGTIKADTAKNGDTLLRIEDKLNLAAQVLNNLVVSVNGMNEETKALLMAILAKIPDGCHCEKVDLTVLIEKLDTIINEIKKDPAGKHEGILSDLDIYLA